MRRPWALISSFTALLAANLASVLMAWLALWNNDLALAIGIASLAWVRAAHDYSTGSCAARFSFI
jgi:hypothetical protein